MRNETHPAEAICRMASHSFAISFRTQSLVAVRDLPTWIEQTTGGTVDRSSTWRWCNYGLKAPCGCHVRLPSVRLGKTRFTTEEAIAWWTAAIAQSAAPACYREDVTDAPSQGGPK